MKLDVEVDGEAFHKDWDGGRKIDDLHRDLMVDPGFAIGETSIHYLEEMLAQRKEQ